MDMHLSAWSFDVLCPRVASRELR